MRERSQWQRQVCPTCQVKLTWAQDFPAPGQAYCPKCGGMLTKVKRPSATLPSVFLCLWHTPLTYRTGPVERWKRKRQRCSADDPCSPRRW